MPVDVEVTSATSEECIIGVGRLAEIAESRQGAKTMRNALLKMTSCDGRRPLRVYPVATCREATRSEIKCNKQECGTAVVLV